MKYTIAVQNHLCRHGLAFTCREPECLPAILRKQAF